MTRDVQVLMYIITNQKKIKQAVEEYGCNFSVSGTNSLLRKNVVFDACSMYMAQIGENVKLLTDGTQEKLNTIMNVSILRYFRNMIDHNYEDVNRQVLLSYIQMVQSDKAIQGVADLVKECTANKKKYADGRKKTN